MYTLVDLVHGTIHQDDKVEQLNIFTFPDGQPHIKFPKPLDRKDGVDILCKIRNPEELFRLRMVADVVNRCSRINDIYIRYLMAARTDRILSFEEPYTLKMVSDDINSMNAESVVLEDVHSDRAVRLIKHSSDSSEFYAKLEDNVFDGKCIVFPDKGSVERNIDLYMEHMSDCIVCEKHRDPDTGKLSGFKIKENGYRDGTPMLVYDDLCDGGGTFIGIANMLKQLNPPSISLAVTHAIQLEGIRRVAEVYDEVWISNSFYDWGSVELPENVHVIDIDEMD